MTNRTPREQLAYRIFRGGFRKDHPNTPPHWDDLPTWIRDAMLVAYLQGKLDGSTNYRAPDALGERSPTTRLNQDHQ